MVQRIDKVSRRRARMGVESIFPGVPILKLSTAGGLWDPWACRLWGQSAKTAVG
jgi:hypothetical protein